jgi:RNA polymerase sigma-70 factor (ECF subfamily)
VEPPDKITEELIQKIKQELDDELDVGESFRQLYLLSHKKVRLYFQRKRFSPQDSLELTQETFIAVYKGLKGFRHEAPFENWLFSIARRIWINELERRRRENHLSLDTGVQGGSDRREQRVASPVDPSPDPLISTLEKEELQVLYEKMQQLPEKMRRCLELRIDGLSYEGIAKLMCISIGAVKAHVHQAKRRLGELLKRYFDDGES